MLDAKRLTILTESAKYDVSCSSSGSSRSSRGGVGNTYEAGICHSFTQDGRCISLIKILLSNQCVYDCLYCVNRRSNDVPRATATPDEICQVVMEFYKRNYIEGLFLSSAVYKNADYTMELLLETVIRLRKLYGFRGYIHLKGIPGADQLLLNRAALFADRMSVRNGFSKFAVGKITCKRTKAHAFSTYIYGVCTVIKSSFKFIHIACWRQ